MHSSWANDAFNDGKTSLLTAYASMKQNPIGASLTTAAYAAASRNMI